MTPEAYIRELAQTITRQEDLTDEQARDVLYELALRIYALLLDRLPQSAFMRQMEWLSLRRRLLPLLMDASTALGRILYDRVAAIETQVLRPAERLFKLEAGQLPPRPLFETLDETRVVGVRLSQLFMPSPRTGVSPFAMQLLALLEKSLTSTFFTDASTPEVARRVIGMRTVAGRQVPMVSKGTVANAWRERFRSITAAVLWAPVTPAAERAAAAAAEGGQAVTLRWRWNAVLDPRTCPRCRPLHGTVAEEPALFPEGPPPLHPLCRCVVIPELGR